MNPRQHTFPSTPKVSGALNVARQYPEEFTHIEQVARLSMLLFDAFRSVHEMSSWEREMLCCAALLHDIGISIDYAKHHKHSRDLIFGSDLPALTASEVELIASIARYHRKAEPDVKHKAFRRLGPQEQQIVRRLAAILRIADGLDRAHENAVTALDVSEVLPEVWEVTLRGSGDLSFAAWGAQRKAGLFAEVMGVQLRFDPKGLDPSDAAEPGE